MQSLDLDKLAANLHQTLAAADGPITKVVDDKQNRLGAFVDSILTKPAAVLGIKSSQPIRFPGDDLLPGDHGVIGTALDQWLQLSYSATPELRAVATGIKMARMEAAGFDLLGRLPELIHSPRELLRAAVVMGWFDAIYHSAGMAMVSSPVTQSHTTSSQELLDLVPRRLVDDLASLTQAASFTLGSVLSAPETAFQIRLETGTAFGDIDLVAGGLLLDVKTSMGTTGTTGRRFTATRSMLRQLLGYVLLDVEDALQLHSIGIYAARYDQLWIVDVADLVRSVTPTDTAIRRAREVFAYLVDSPSAGEGGGRLPGERPC